MCIRDSFLCLRGGIGKREGRNCFYGGVLPVDKMDYLDNRDGMEDGKWGGCTTVILPMRC